MQEMRPEARLDSSPELPGELLSGYLHVFSSREMAIVSTSLPQGVGSLFPGEEAFVKDSIASRRTDFATGRWCSRLALARLGVEPVMIPVGPSREPIWPDGIKGSITHSFGRYCAAVCRQPRRIGIDVEAVDRKEFKEILPSFLNGEEREYLGSLEGEQLHLYPSLAFSLKESFFKFAFEEVGHYFDFFAVKAEVDWESRSADIKVLDDLGDRFRKGSRFPGRFLISGKFIFTMVSGIRPQPAFRKGGS